MRRINSQGSLMNFFVRLFIIVLTIFTMSSAYAEMLKPNLAEILMMEKHGDLAGAATQLTPCLAGKVSLPPSDLEECLYVGERIIGLLLADIYKSGEDEKNISEKLSKFGIKLVTGFDGNYYNHDYFRALAKKFPKSKHADEFEYVLMKADAPQIGVTPWEDTSAKLKKFLNKYPQGPYAQAANFWLGCIYEGLWALLRPDTTEAGYRDYAGLSSNNPSEDAKRALYFRKMSIHYYQSGLVIKAVKSLDVDEYAISESVRSLEALRSKGKDVGVGCIISD